MARAIWKGVIRFEDIEVPVKLYSAVEDRTVHFRLLHEADLAPVKQKMVHSETAREIDPSQIQKAAEVERGVFVIVHDDELESIEPEPSRTIEIARFVDPTEINHQWYTRPYYLGPDEDDSKAYWCLAEALQRQNKEGVARWVMRKKNYVGALRARDGYLMLIALRFSGEVIDTTELPQPGGRSPSAKEVAMAEQIVSMLAEKFNPKEYRDEFRNRMLDLIETKAKGRKLTLEKVEKRPPERSLSDALKASLEAVRQKKGA